MVFIALAYFPLNQPYGTIHSLNIALDNHIGLQPIFSAPYLLFIPVFWLFFLLIFLKNRQFKALAVTIIIVYTFSYIIYLFYQTKVTRPVIFENDIFSRLVKAIYSHDNPYDAFPSLHSSLATVFCSIFLADSLKKALAHICEFVCGISHSVDAFCKTTLCHWRGWRNCSWSYSQLAGLWVWHTKN